MKLVFEIKKYILNWVLNNIVDGNVSLENIIIEKYKSKLTPSKPKKYYTRKKKEK